MTKLRRITLDEWDSHYAELKEAGLREPSYGGPLRRHVDDGGDTRLLCLSFDASPAALRLWNFLLTEEDRLHEARAQGKKIVGTMKDLGTIPVMAYSLPNIVAFYPDGAWWIPCIMELSKGLLAIADSLGIDESFCPVRAMLGAFTTEDHFPIPDLLTCSVGATCDDFSSISQRLEGLGYPILWWEIPHRRRPMPDEPSITLPGGFVAPVSQVNFVRSELERIRESLGDLAGRPLNDDVLRAGIRQANRIRRAFSELRTLAYTSDPCPMPALEMLIAEMLAMHFCSDREECLAIVEDMLAEIRRRVSRGEGYMPKDAARIFWANPVADLRVMNLLEDCGGRICGTDYMFAHAFDEIPEDMPPMDALAQMALADPMVGPSSDRADRMCRDIAAFGAEAVIISRMPGASHCATEGAIISEIVRSRLDMPVVEIEVPPLTDSMLPSIATRIRALVEIVMQRRSK